MITDFPAPCHIPGLRALWQEAFGDDDLYLDCFFSTGFRPERCLCTQDGSQVRAALYWFPCRLQEKPVAYVYAVATARAFRGRGLASGLMEALSSVLKMQGYAGAILMPASPSLFDFYRRFGYKNATSVREFTCKAGDAALSLTQISPAEYAVLRKSMLPPCSVEQEPVTLKFLQTQADFYKGNDFLLCGSGEGGKLHTQEFLGNPEAAPGILAALGLQEGCFRSPGTEKPFTMYHSLCPGPIPAYFGLAMD